jgi:hypothetical protein
LINPATDNPEILIVRHLRKTIPRPDVYDLGRRGRRRKKLLDLKEKRGYWKLKEEELHHALWRTGFGRGCGPVIRQNAEIIIIIKHWSFDELSLSIGQII